MQIKLLSAMNVRHIVNSIINVCYGRGGDTDDKDNSDAVTHKGRFYQPRD